MTTNQTIDGVLVSRELIERILNRTRWHGDPLKDELRALLDAPACSACNDTGRMHEPGCEPGACTACLEKPATQPQGEPVAIVTGSTVQWLPGAGKIPDRSPLYAEQPAPVAVVPEQTYRLLGDGDVIMDGDETLNDDTATWGKVPMGVFIGMPYNRRVMLPVRRAKP